MDILTDDEINDAWAGVSGSCPEIEINDLARALEQRILTKLRSAEPVAWMTEDGRVISAEQKSGMLRDGGAGASSVAPYYRPLFAHPAPSEGDRRDAWQPIRTAPRDGTVVLLICMNANTPAPEFGHWSDEDSLFRAGYPDDFASMALRGLKAWHDQATHWMPSPVAPRAAMSKEQGNGG